MSAPGPIIERSRTGFRLVWIVPIIAAVIGITLLFNAWQTRGPRVSIIFDNAEGLAVGKTLVKYRDVTIGRVSEIRLSEDRSQVEVIADLVRSAAALASEGSHFWVVRPRIGIGWATGLDTLLSGAYIGVESGPATIRKTTFRGLESPPPLRHGAVGKRIVLQAAELGSVSIGAPVYFRGFQVGQVIDEYLEDITNTTRVVLWIDAPHDLAVTQASRFWNASGVDIGVTADGIKVRSQSFTAILAGGVSFKQGADAPDANVPAAGAEFMLYRDEQSALAPPDGEPHVVRMRFEKPLRGLTVGAPIEFVGVEIGTVTAIDVGYESATQHFPVFVTGTIFPRRMGLAYTTLLAGGKAETDDDLARLTAQLIGRGLRVQPRQGSLLTGRLYLALDFIPAAPRVSFNARLRPVELPTLDGHFGELQEGLDSLVRKINALPLQAVATNANKDLLALHGTFDSINTALLPTAASTLSDVQVALQSIDRILTDNSPFRSNLDDTLVSLQETLRSVRALSDTLNRHPEALIRGRAKDSHHSDDQKATPSQ